MPKIEMSFEESQKFLKGAKEGKNVSPPRKEYTFEESQQLLKEANAVRPTAKTAAGVPIPRDSKGGDIAGPDAKATVKAPDGESGEAMVERLKSSVKEVPWPK